MDIPREPVKNRRRLWQAGIAGAVILTITLVLSSLKPAAPSVDRGTLLFDTVRLGEMVREVRGPGTLVPEHIRFISALASARVERILTQPGQQVQAGSVLLELSNPDVQIQALQAEQQLTAAQAQLVSLRTSLENQRLTQEGLVVGGSSGINVAGAVRLAKELGPGHRIVTMLCDYGTRYQSKLFNPKFLRERNLPAPHWL
jgi:multidrug efflux pump subunit AcrA (membrane-fusion protein)